ncbi:MAG: glycosyltransferase family 4 protein [Pyrinomonadaceae bacterium]|nr:glycosyltransferase family 4 protein [Pyrinomonadaceae bacterium]
MRIAVINWTRRRVGGVETYLNTIIPELAQAGHEIAFWSEVDEPGERAQISLPPGSPSWSVAELGAERALQELREWHPSISYTHNLSDPKLEAETQSIAPSVFFAHDYYGTCISGAKTFKFPVVKPCDRRFGWQCLLHYFPHRCGGWSPITMMSLYNLQSSRQKLLHKYDAIVTHSNHMLAELIKHGLSPQSAYNFPYYVQQRKGSEVAAKPTQSAVSRSAPNVYLAQGELVSAGPSAKTPLRLLFSGRMEFLKGGHVFLDALPRAAASLGRPLHVVFAGEGRERPVWERQAADLQRRHPELEIEFPGWVDRTQMDRLLDTCDLQVVPSLWPEPFGLVGPEAGLRGVPAAAFSVGGVPDWLVDGVNGYLAPGDPPTSQGLADAIVRCLRDPAEHAQLRQGAVRVAEQFSIKSHLAALMEVFEHVAARRP